MEEGKDYDQKLSPTTGIAIARIVCITSTATANDLELHSIDIELNRPVFRLTS
jgi:hypothetical protein